MLPNIYQGNYRLLAIAPIVMIVISLILLPGIKFGVDFRGGTLVTLSLQEPVDAQILQDQLKNEGLEATVRAFHTSVGERVEIEVPQSDALVEADDLRDQFNLLLPTVSQLEVAAYHNSTYEAEYTTKKAELDAIASELFVLAGKDRAKMNITGTNDLQQKFSEAYATIYSDYQKSISGPIDKYVEYDSISVQTVSPALTEYFIEDAKNVVILAAIVSLILVFLFFRAIVPAIAVLTGAFCDIVIALGAMSLLGIPFTLASFAALLMLLGFSLDTDILLTTRILKRKGDPRENAFDAMKTGLTMSVMAIVAFGALFVLSILTHIPTYYEISAVALAGLVGDMFATWGINGVMILHYVETRRKA
jgi:preprotein translocase subunit SecF